MKLNFHHLRAFAEVARTGSFTGAAECLYLTQPAISKAVGSLEEVLGIALLERTSRQVKLTEAGVSLFSHARSIFALEQAALQDIEERRGLRKGCLHIGASTTIATYWLGQDLALFLERYPQIDIRVSSGNTETMVHQVLEGLVEVALVEGPVDEERLNCELWDNEPLLLVTKPGVERAHLGQCRWILREEGSGTARVVAEILTHLGIVPARQVVVQSNQAAVQMVVAGVGVAIVPAIMAAHHLERGELACIPWSQGELQRSLSKISLKGRPASPARAAFESFLGETRGQIKSVS
ncbi:MAG: LysR family transcriptional regulator [Ferrovum sp.]|jgi:DNA-binding transcriptional LysR family regulator|uniref:LysR family transcriptional regulator n=1 Tax=Ferrovum sp. TaxID=2609467 RepID=UPI00262F2D2D|nr:LysR family transcriptional regulator [Ferrovum sp.]MBW8066686.1 LysR family transcriptional regulator [Ferrovum sp.]